MTFLQYFTIIYPQNLDTQEAGGKFFGLKIRTQSIYENGGEKVCSETKNATANNRFTKIPLFRSFLSYASVAKVFFKLP